MAKLIIYNFKHFIIPTISAFRGNLVSVPLNLCTNQTAFSYGNQGWHWIQDLANEVMFKPNIPMEETRFYQFFQHVQCNSYTQAMTFFNVSLMENLPRIPFGSFPWGHFDREVVIDPDKFFDTSKDLFLWFETGPAIDDALRKEFDRTVTLLTSIKLNRYNLSFSKFQFPSVAILKNKSGKVRFLNADGAHRFAVLSALGYDRVVVRLIPERYPPILEEDIEMWPFVQSGLISKIHASMLFQLYFTLDGSERAQKVHELSNLQIH
jgi:hypothetical protein